MINSVIKILIRDLKTYNRSINDIIYIAGIYILLIILFPLSIGTSSEMLIIISPAILWVCALFTSISILDKFFVSDINEGWFDQLLLSQIPLELVVLVKALAHWMGCSTCWLPDPGSHIPDSQILGFSDSQSVSFSDITDFQEKRALQLAEVSSLPVPKWVTVARHGLPMGGNRITRTSRRISATYTEPSLC